MIHHLIDNKKKDIAAEGSKSAGMKTRISRFMALIIIVAIALFVGIGFYSQYVYSLIEEESSSNLLSTFNQINNTFTLFAERNWNYLKDWDSNLQILQENGDVDSAWMEFCSTNNWDYDNMYLFNNDGDYITVDGNRGTTSIISGIFTADYEKGKALASSYYTQDGTRKAVFAVDLTAGIVVDSVEYTGLAVSYLNSTLENLLVDEIYDGHSDCYIVAGDGTVLLSLEPKTEVTDHIYNMYDFLQNNISAYDTSADDITSPIKSLQTGSLKCTYNENDIYLVYQPVGIEDWSIVGIIEEDVVDSGLQNIVRITVMFLIAFCLIGFGLVIYIVIAIAEGKITTQKMEHNTLRHKAQLSQQLFAGLSQIVERYVVIDFETGYYEYHEQIEPEGKYPPSDKYTNLLEELSRRFVITSGNTKMKMGSMLSETYLRNVLKKEGDMVKFEYASRDNLLHKQMYILPLEWNDLGEIKKIIFVAMDIGRQVELENQVNTDDLTGLFNERCFSSALVKKDEEKQPFTLFYLDLDRFKPVNDTYGHDVGDKLLRSVAERILACIRDKDQAFRIGGDEYAVIINADISNERREEMVASLKKAISTPFDIDGNVISVGTSCGYAIYPHDSHVPAQIRILADRRMYEDKKKNHSER